MFVYDLSLKYMLWAFPMSIYFKAQSCCTWLTEQTYPKLVPRHTFVEFLNDFGPGARVRGLKAHNSVCWESSRERLTGVKGGRKPIPRLQRLALMGGFLRL